MARPRKLELVAERAEMLYGQLVGALQVLEELRGCLERLAAIEVVPVYAELVERRKSTRYGEYVYPVLQLCPQGSQWYGECEQVHVTRFRGFAEAFVEAARVSRILSDLASDARRALVALEGLEQLLARLSEETRRVEDYAERLKATRRTEEEVVPVG